MLIGKALNNLHSQWLKLVRHLEDGRLHIDNNWVNYAIHPLCGRAQ